MDDEGTEPDSGQLEPDTAEVTFSDIAAPYLESLAAKAGPRVSLEGSAPGAQIQIRPPAQESPRWVRAALAELLPQPGALGDYLQSQEPSERLATLLAAIDPDDVDDFSLVELVAAYKRMEAWSAAKAARAAAVLAERDSVNPTWPGDIPGRTKGECVVGHELSMRLRITRHAAVKMATCGRALTGMFEPTGELLERGLIDWPRAQAIVSNLLDLPAEVAMAAQWEVLPKAPGRTLRQLNDDLEKAVIAVDPDSADQRHIAARQKRCVYRPRPLPDGMAMLSARLPAGDAIAMHLALDASARAAKNNGDTRSLDHLRADSFSLMAHTALTLGYIGPHTHTYCPCGCQDTAKGTGTPPATADAPLSEADQPVTTTAPPQDAGPPSLGHAPSPDAEPPDIAEAPPPVESPPGATPPLIHEPAPPPVAAPSTAPPPRIADGPPLPGHRLPGGALPTIRVGMIGGGRADIAVLVPLNVLDPEPRDPGTTALDRDPEPVAELDGYGPIPPIVARALATGGTWRRLLTDPTTDQVLEVGRTRYQPPTAIADHVRHRDRTCIAPACSHPARTADLDHIHEWHHGGATSADNLGPQCTADHRAKSIGALTLAYATDRTYAWTTPTGHGYLRRPDGTTITLPSHTAKTLRKLVKDAEDRHLPVDPTTIDTILAAISIGADPLAHWVEADTAHEPEPEHSWAQAEPPF